MAILQMVTVQDGGKGTRPEVAPGGFRQVLRTGPAGRWREEQGEKSREANPSANNIRGERIPVSRELSWNVPRPNQKEATPMSSSQ